GMLSFWRTGRRHRRPPKCQCSVTYGRRVIIKRSVGRTSLQARSAAGIAVGLQKIAAGLLDLRDDLRRHFLSPSADLAFAKRRGRSAVGGGEIAQVGGGEAAMSGYGFERVELGLRRATAA